MYEDVVRDINWGYIVVVVVEIFCLVKDVGFKVVSYMMFDFFNVGMECDMD